MGWIYIEEVNGYAQILIFSPLAALVHCQVCTELENETIRNEFYCLLEPLKSSSEGPSKTLRFLVREDPSMLHGVAETGPWKGFRVLDPQKAPTRLESVELLRK